MKEAPQGSVQGRAEGLGSRPAHRAADARNFWVK